jgi:hypothetical protein
MKTKAKPRRRPKRRVRRVYKEPAAIELTRAIRRLRLAVKAAHPTATGANVIVMFDESIARTRSIPLFGEWGDNGEED